MVFASSSSQATRKVATRLAANLRAGGKSGGATILGLVGELGAGKTTFVQGLFSGLGLSPSKATSPTFVFMRRAALRRRGFRSLYHIDAYRIEDERTIKTLGLDGLLKDSGNVIVIEWADRIKRFLPKKTRWIKFKIGKGESERLIFFTKTK